MKSAGEELATLYSQNVFPSMKVTWGTHPNHIGHMSYPGCFRCHDGDHVSKGGKTITQDCANCHNLLAHGRSQTQGAGRHGDSVGNPGLNLPADVHWYRHELNSCAVPSGLRDEIVESLSPTLKRGANKLCASGAVRMLTKSILRF